MNFVRYISESVYPFEFQMSKLLKHFKKKKLSHLRTMTSIDHSTIHSEVCHKFWSFMGNRVFYTYLVPGICLEYQITTEMQRQLTKAEQEFTSLLHFGISLESIVTVGIM